MVGLGLALLATLVVTLLVAAVVVAVRLRFEQPHRRKVVRVRHVLGPACLVAAAVGLGVTPLGATTVELTYAVGAGADRGVGDGVTDEGALQRVEVPVAVLPGTTYIVRGDGVDVQSWRRSAAGLEVTVRFPTGATPGSHRASLRLTPYPATLPGSLLGSLHDGHPVVAMVGASGVVLGPLYLLARLLLDGEKPVLRTRRRWLRQKLGE